MNNTLQTNSFVGGLNMDIDIASIPDNQYRYAENVRIVTDNEGTSGVLQNLQGTATLLGGDFITSDQTIISAVTIDKYAIILTADLNDICRLYRVWGYDDLPLKNILVIKGLLGYNKDSNVKIVANYESDINIKVYMSDGESTIRSLNIMDNQYVHIPGVPNNSLDNEGNVKDPAAIDITPSAMLNPPLITRLGTGSLTSGSVQYSYQLFNARGSNTLTSATSNLVHLTKSNASSELNAYSGTEKGQLTDKSVVMIIPLTDSNSGINYNSFYNRCRIYRIKYVDNTELPTIDIIDEVNISSNVAQLTYEDRGGNALSSVTIEEFNAKNDSTFTPSTIEKKDNILFAAGIKQSTWDPEYDARAYRCNIQNQLYLEDGNRDSNIIINSLPEYGSEAEKEIYRSIKKDHDCINPYNAAKGVNNAFSLFQYSNKKVAGKRVLGGSGLNVNYRFVVFDTVLDTMGPVGSGIWQDGAMRYPEYAKIYVDSALANNLTFKYLEEDYAYATGDSLVADVVEYPDKGWRQPNYADPYIASKYKGYQRDEIYRFGIVFYNSKGIASSVSWIGDIRMPHPADYCGLYAGTNLIGKALGIQFEVNNVPSGAIAYDIVRCKRTIDDRTIVTQGVISSTTNFPYPYIGSSGLNNDKDIRPVVPLGYTGSDIWWKFVNVSNIFAGNVSTNETSALLWEKVKNDYVVLISPELDIMQEGIMGYLEGSYAEFAYCLDTRSQRVRDNKQIKYFVTTQYTYIGHTTTEAPVNPLVGAYMDENVGGYIMSTDGSGGNVHVVANLIGKRYLPFPIPTGLSNRSIAEISKAIFPPILTQWNIEDKNPFYRAIGDMSYLNLGMMANRNGSFQGGVAKAGYFGYCAVLHGNFFDNIIRRSGALSSYCRASNTVKDFLQSRQESVFIIPVVNIKRSIIPYGGNSYTSRTNSVYISTNSYTLIKDKKATKNITYGGDTCIAVHDHRTANPWPESGQSGSDQRHLQISCTDYIPVETSINLALQYGQTTSKSCVDQNRRTDVYLGTTIEGGNMGGYFKQTKPYYAYNDAYSVQGDVKKYVPRGSYDINDMNNINRIVYSEVKTNNEITDSWLQFKPANYLDVDSQYGKITNLKSFNDKLMFWQDKSVGVASVNDRSLITDSNESSLVLGTGGILTRYDYVTTGNGSSIINDDSIVQSDSTLYWYDSDKNEICSYSDQIHKLSKEKGVQTFLNSTKGLVVHDALYDSKFNEVQFCFNEKALVYNEYTQGFTSFYTYNPESHLKFSDKLLYIKDNKIVESTNNTLNVPQAKIQFVVNKDPLLTKTFDNVYFNGKFSVLKEMLVDAKFATKNQQATILEDYINGGFAIDYREDTYRFAIGREQSEDPSSYPGRLKGKYLICDYTINCTDKPNFNLPYVNTTYRYSLV